MGVNQEKRSSSLAPAHLNSVATSKRLGIQRTRLFHVTGQEVSELEERNPDGTVQRTELPIDYHTPAVNHLSENRIVVYKNFEFDVDCEACGTVKCVSVGGDEGLVCTSYTSLYSLTSGCDIFGNNEFLTGDINGDGEVNLNDVPLFSDALFAGI